MLKPKECINDGRLIAFVDGNDSDDAKDAVAFHLNECDSCRQMTEQLRSSMEAVKQLWTEQLAGIETTDSVLATEALETRRATMFFARRPSTQLLGTSVLIAGVVLLAVYVANLRLSKHEIETVNVPFVEQADSELANTTTQIDSASDVSSTSDESELVLASINAHANQRQQAARLKRSLELLEAVEELSKCASESKSYLRNRNFGAIQ